MLTRSYWNSAQSTVAASAIAEHDADHAERTRRRAQEEEPAGEQRDADEHDERRHVPPLHAPTRNS